MPFVHERLGPGCEILVVHAHLHADVKLHHKTFVLGSVFALSTSASRDGVGQV